MYKSKSEIEKLCIDYEAGKLAPTAKEKLVIHPKIAYEVTDEDILGSIPFDELRKLENIYGRVSRFSQFSPVKNLRWDYLHFVNTDLFREAGLGFQQSVRNTKGTKIKPSYTRHLPGTKAYRDFWLEEYTRIKNGYEPEINGKKCGVRIGGEFYFYLNYGWIKKRTLDDEGNVSTDESDLPDFLVMDYYYYREIE